MLIAPSVSRACRAKVAAAAGQVKDAGAHKAETEAKTASASTSAVSSKASTPEVKAAKGDDAHGKGCCIIA